MFGKTISSTYFDLPVTLSRPSLRGTDSPTMRSRFIRYPSSSHCSSAIVSRRDPAAGRADGIVYARLRHNGGEVSRGKMEKGHGVDRRFEFDVYSRPQGYRGTPRQETTGFR